MHQWDKWIKFDPILPPHLELADLHVQRERVERHWADEGDPRGHRVHDLELSIEPETLQLGEDVQGLELFEVQDLCVGKPEFLGKGIFAICTRN